MKPKVIEKILEGGRRVTAYRVEAIITGIKQVIEINLYSVEAITYDNRTDCWLMNVYNIGNIQITEESARLIITHSKKIYDVEPF